MIFDLDDWSEEHDCREKLVELRKINPKFKASLFTVVGKTTLEMLNWVNTNKEWVEIYPHGWLHNSNYECAEWTEAFMTNYIKWVKQFKFFQPIFKAPGWQISEGCYKACLKKGWGVADQPYNTSRRPEGLKVYEVGEDSYHGHTWDCGCNNGIYEDWDNIVEKVKKAKEFQFISEVV